MKPILCIDFDGVLHSYTTPWERADVIPDPPVPGAMKFLAEAVNHFDVQVFSSRSHQEGGIEAMKAWLWENIRDHYDVVFAGDPKDLNRAIALRDSISFPMVKPAAMITLDDRAMTFMGTWPIIGTLLAFKPWNRR
jgi:hypothetical protein